MYKTQKERLQERANILIKYNYSDAFIESMLYTHKSEVIGLKQIKETIEIAKTNKQ